MKERIDSDDFICNDNEMNIFFYDSYIYIYTIERTKKLSLLISQVNHRLHGDFDVVIFSLLCRLISVVFDNVINDH